MIGYCILFSIQMLLWLDIAFCFPFKCCYDWTLAFCFSLKCCYDWTL